MVKYCPFCGEWEIDRIGIMSFGMIYKCKKCKLVFVVADPKDFP